MVGVLRVGCAMWTHKEWPGRVIPQSARRGGELAAYSALVGAVEGNTTFYALPSHDTASKWAACVPVDFRFMFKLPRTVTHERKLRNVESLVREFFDVLEPCVPWMDPVAIQLPASFGPESLGVLDDFLGSVRADIRFAVEVRHLDFFDGASCERELNDLLFRRGTDRIILDSRAVFAGPRVTPSEHEAFENKPRVPARAVATNDRPVVRFIGQTEPSANSAFWRPWVETSARWLSDGRSPTVFIHTPDNVDALMLARQFYDEVRAEVPELPAQPEAPTPREPGLFD